jgi:hypothetical protein
LRSDLTQIEANDETSLIETKEGRRKPVPAAFFFAPTSEINSTIVGAHLPGSILFRLLRRQHYEMLDDGIFS